MITKEMIEIANNVEIFDYLAIRHPEDVTISGDWAKFNDDPSLFIKKGYKKWSDFSGKRVSLLNKWNSSIDFLMQLYGMTFPEAAEELISFANGEGSSKTALRQYVPEKKSFCLPTKDADSKNAMAYLIKSRGIEYEVVRDLLRCGLIYQSISDSNPNIKNVVFVNDAKDYYEVRGTSTTGKAFHGCGKVNTNGYWGFAHGKAEKVYVCEASIDAISLFIINSLIGNAKDTVYVSIGGVDNFKTVDRLISEYGEDKIILSFDNDDAGRATRSMYPKLKSAIPRSKDWNEDLQNIKKERIGA